MPATRRNWWFCVFSNHTTGCPRADRRRRNSPGDTAHGAWIQIWIHIEEPRMGPDVRAVHRHKNRNVSKNLDAARVCVVFERKPLAEELKLAPGLGLDFFP